jgi:hypothetical protein
MSEEETKRLVAALETLARVAERVEEELKRGGTLDRLVIALERGNHFR